MSLCEIYELEMLLSARHEMEKRGEDMGAADKERLAELLGKEEAWLAR